jgi:hypothetical protein
MLPNKGEKMRPRKRLESSCIHYWKIDPNTHDGIAEGTCQKCGTSKTFINAFDGWYNHRFYYDPNPKTAWKPKEALY